MKAKILAVAIAVAITTSTPLRPQSGSALDDLQAFERSLVRLVDEGIDPQSPTYLDLQRDVSAMRSAAGEIRKKKEKNETLQKRRAGLEKDIENDQPEISRLDELLKQEKEKLQEEEQRWLTECNRHNANPPDSSDKAAVAAYKAEADRGNAWKADIVSRRNALNDGAEARRVAELKAEGEAIRGEIDVLRSQSDQTIPDDMRIFLAARQRAFARIAEMAKHLKPGRLAGILPSGGAIDQLVQIDFLGGERGGRRFDTSIGAGLGYPSSSYSPPPDVAGNPNIRKLMEEKASLEVRIMELKARVFDPGAKAEEKTAAFKQLQQAESERLWKAYQESRLGQALSPPAARTKSVPPLSLPGHD